MNGDKPLSSNDCGTEERRGEIRKDENEYRQDRRMRETEREGIVCPTTKLIDLLFSEV